MKRTGYVWHERFAWHDTGTHAGLLPSGGMIQPYQNFENPESKSRFNGLVAVSGLIDSLVRLSPRPATEAELRRIHTADYVARIKRDSSAGGGDGGDGFTPFGPGSYDIALLAAGGAITAVDAVLSGEADNAYALVRPPGHHARPETGMGYCLFSNVTIAIEHARVVHNIERVAIVDYDVHHGNGAQAIYWDDPNVLTISLHQDSLFPQDTGTIEEQGSASARGTCINVPLPAGCGNEAYTEAIRRIAGPAITAFKPDLIMVSSGFDAGAADPLGRMAVTASAYRDMAQQLVELADDACDGRLVFSHEGGYSPVYVPFCGLAVLEALSGVDTGVGDPFAVSFENSPAHALKPWQDEVISAAEELALALQLEVRT
ncbi:class II histone deacetylase [Saxibacter everestensis]|uniref:Class II histone deacetylase n=1 Tax=Saxibacter everestensis TaxID=2909229 RepID=A0ABY8QR61_9MICO|nr:class II histone deacetylase [Brevibacteriaceae bacterium ZFBP1038]